MCRFPKSYDFKFVIMSKKLNKMSNLPFKNLIRTCHFFHINHKKSVFLIFFFLMTTVNYLKIPKDCPVGRDELLSWINSIVGVGYKHIEDCANGAAFCQVIDALHPDTINLGKVKFDATLENDIVNNYKILQEGFYANQIQKNLNISEFINKKVNATLEMLQWLYQYAHMLLSSISYNPFERRKLFGVKEPKMTRISSYSVEQLNYSPPKYKQEIAKPETSYSPPVQREIRRKIPPKHLSPPKQLNASLSSSSSLSAANPDSERKIRHLEKKVKKLQYELDATSKERDFYWKRLRQIEIYCTTNDSIPAQEILEILYQTDSENGFVTPE